MGVAAIVGITRPAAVGLSRQPSPHLASRPPMDLPRLPPLVRSTWIGFVLSVPSPVAFVLFCACHSTVGAWRLV